MQFDILTIFPDIIFNYAKESILGRAQNSNLIKIQAHNFRDYTKDKHKKVDDTPYGGGAGMVLQVQPIYDCLKSIGVLPLRGSKRCVKSKTKVIIMDPDGKKFNQKMAEEFSKLDRLVLIAGRYEGYDERVYSFVDEKVSVGDYVLAGGELPALIITEAVSRLISGVLGNQDSLKEETFNKIDSEYPQYTKPADFMGMKVPNILLSGDHKKIEEWRKKKRCF